MKVGLTMSTDGLLRRDDRDFFLQRIEASEIVRSSSRGSR
jgi:hypothetical protein